MPQPAPKYAASTSASIQRQSEAADYLGAVSRMTIAATSPEAVRRPQAVPVDEAFERSMVRMLGSLVS